MREKRTYRVLASICLMIALALPCGAAAGYKLGVSDRIKVKVQEWPDLGGEFTVNPDGIVSLPLIGDVQATGRGIAELAQEISHRLQQRAASEERPIAAVEIISFRPFFILGDVERPGQYPYRPGLTVLQAIGIAGGYYRPPSPGLLRLGRDVALAKGDLDTLSLKLVRLKARAARLQATTGGKDITFPAELLASKDDPVLASILAGERASLTLERDTAAFEAQALESIKALYQQEIASLQNQVGALKREQETVQRNLRALQSLSTKGLALIPSQLTLERTIAQSASEQSNVETAIVRARENIALAERKTRELAMGRNRDNTRALEETKDEIRSVEARIETSQALLDEARISAPREARDPAGGDGANEPILLIRREGAATREIAADESSAVEPDDVVKVPRASRKLPARSSADLSR